METTIDRINALQRRILAGEDPSAEEMNAVIQQLRSERVGATTAAKERKAKKEPPQIDLATLLGVKKENKDAP